MDLYTFEVAFQPGPAAPLRCGAVEWGRDGRPRSPGPWAENTEGVVTQPLQRETPHVKPR